MSHWLRVSVAVAAFLVSVLACGTAVTQTAHYVCPTPIPTAVVPQPTPLPGTPLPFPTPIPLPPTPYVITPPQDFYVGDAVYVGQSGAALRLRFRLLGVQAQPADPVGGEPRSLYTWRLQIANLGSAPYDTVPVALMTMTRIDTFTGQLSGTWNTSETAMQDAGFTGENYDALQPGSSRIYRLAAYGPSGNARQPAYTLDGASNRITWVNAGNPYCSGDVAD